MITEIVDQAIALGRPVFPVRLCKDACLKCDICKAPACPHRFHDATKDLDRIRQIFQRFPGQLIGTPTGEISGFDVLDIDTSRHPEAVNWWLSHRKYISKTRAHQTGSSGLHLLFQHSPRARTGNGRLGIGVDVKANGGYIVWWPAYGRKVLLDVPLAPWPEWLLGAQDPKHLVPLRELYRTRPEILYVGDVAPDANNQVELRLEQLERGKAYEFLFRCTLPARQAPQRFRIAKASLAYELPGQGGKQETVEANLVVEYTADAERARERSGDVRRVLARYRPTHKVVDIDGARVDFGEGAWGLCRASNTGPILVLRFEARSEARRDEIRREVEDAVADAIRRAGSPS